jgi:hypothetical protein
VGAHRTLLRAGGTGTRKGGSVPRHPGQRTFPDGLQIPVDEQGAKTAMAVVDTNPAGLYSGTNPLVRPFNRG